MSARGRHSFSPAPEVLPATRRPRRVETISAREREIIELACQGLTDKEICRALSLSLTTVRTYWGRAREKLGAVNRAQVVAQVSAMDRAGEANASRDGCLQAMPVGIWVYWPDLEAVVLDDPAAAIFNASNPQQLSSPSQLLASVSMLDREAFEAVLRCPRHLMATPGVVHRMVLLNGGFGWVRTVVMGPVDDPNKGKGWVLASMPLDDLLVDADSRATAM